MVHWHQRDVAATRIGPGSLTPPDALVAAAIAAARRRGLAVMVFPIVWVEERAAGKWRGTLAPASIDAWWSAYERFVLHYAGLAAGGGAEWLSVGSELGSTEAWRQRWYHLIGRVRRRYRGKLTYSANWDHYQHVRFWRRLDAFGVNGYWALASDRRASGAAMQARWRQVAAALSRHAGRLGKPLVITEVGYLSRDGGAIAPWDYGRAAAVDLEEQRRAYTAFAGAWTATGGLAGVFFWTWDGDGGRRDGGYTPRGKPAEAVLRRFFAARERWSR